MTMTWQTIADHWNAALETAPPPIDSYELHAFALFLCGDPSPRGDTSISVQAIRQIADDRTAEPAALPQYEAFFRGHGCDPVPGARWALSWLS